MRACTTCDQRFSGDATFCPHDGTRLEDVAATQIALARRADEFTVGSIVGGVYRVDSILGEGGMGVVFAVTHLRLGKRFALKLLKRDLARDPETRARFLIEAQAAGQIRHPNVVEITDYTALPDGTPYLVMEYLEGQPLARMIKLGGAIPALRAIAILRDVASALQAAHEAGVVHRDLKPDNVFVIQVKEGYGTRETAKILDFGVAKVAGSAKLTRTGVVFGTPHYMSPEQASGATIDARTDVYALGVIMYEMFTGRVPFEADTYMGILTKHLFEEPIALSQVGGPTRELGALEDITLKALAKRPEARYASMRELLIDLDRVVSTGPDGQATLASRIEGLRRPDFPGSEAQHASLANLADELEPPARAELTAAVANRRRARVRLLATGVVVALLVPGVGFALSALVGQRSHSTAPKAPTPRKDDVLEATPASSASAESVRAATAGSSASPSSDGAGLALLPLSAALPTSRPRSTPTAQAPKPRARPVSKPLKPAATSEAEDPWGKK